LLQLIRDAHTTWQSPEVVGAPFYLWLELLSSLGLPVNGSSSFLGGLIAILVVVPLGAIGGLVLELLWVIPYLAVLAVITAVDMAITAHLLAPSVVAVLAWRHSARLRDWIRPPLPTSAVIAIRPAVGTARLGTMEPAHDWMYTRVDPLTRTRFALGERFVLCVGGCGRVYKLVTCERLAYRCPVDGASLHVSATPVEVSPT
jgi:hypothetical protein